LALTARYGRLFEPGAFSARPPTLALSEENEVLILVIGRDGATSEIYVWKLHRERRVWLPVEVIEPEFPRWVRLLGFDGDRVLLVDGEFAIHRYSFCPKVQ
jgi:hypothetical protein